MNKTLITDLTEIAQLAESRYSENLAFRHFMAQQDAAATDELVFPLQEAVTKAVDCCACGNCCRSMMVDVTEEEANSLAEALNEPLAVVKSKYIEESLSGRLLVSSMPCHFLEGNLCRIYDNRFSTCRSFPHLDQPGFNARLFFILQHYGRCPIVFNVVEALKACTNFTP
ncbi:YkgJ family cysteine cluster protein [Flavihumibacter petaseus]|uniref:YkgJ family cysteine cluster protein n=1 Tax=Flavihumibacter petaseus NBRC 106054 TaxID=1220578 RepID=A0A0E9N294_9BACT|nr:YkgJ family cysteine cluster protein [Flavihumibacter petaseus]GAO43903.1 hypothetical protein FPE01S_02_10090 [Flavihumibacter petaseus NBRC 106054]